MTSAEPAGRIVVGVDGDLESAAALRWALKEGVRSAASVEVVHCYPPRGATFVGAGTEHERKAAAGRLLETVVQAALLEMPEKPAVLPASLPGPPRTVLVERSEGALLLVIGVHEGTDLHDFVLGRTGGACVRHARCPTVIVGLDQQVMRHPVTD